MCRRVGKLVKRQMTTKPPPRRLLTTKPLPRRKDEAGDEKSV